MKNEFNQVAVEGRLTADPKIIEKENYIIVNFSIANNWIKTVEGTKKEEVNFFNVSAIVSKNFIPYLKKGQLVLASGKLEQSRWTKDGKNYQSVAIKAINIELLSSGNNSTSAQEAESPVYTEEPVFADEGDVNPDSYFS